LKAWLFVRPRVVTCKRVTICLSRSKALLIKSIRNNGFLTLKMWTASFVPCIMFEKPEAGSAFSTVSQFTVNGTNMCYSLCYERPLTDIRDLKIPRFRLRVRGRITRTRTRLHGKPIKLKILRVTPGTIRAKMLRKTSSEISRKHFSIKLNWLFSFLTIQYATNKDLCLRLKDGRCLVYFYQSVSIKRHPFKLT